MMILKKIKRILSQQQVRKQNKARVKVDIKLDSFILRRNEHRKLSLFGCICGGDTNSNYLFFKLSEIGSVVSTCEFNSTPRGC